MAPPRAGAKTWPPRWLTRSRRRRSRGPEVREFLEHYCRATKDTIAAPAGERLVLRPWQVQLIDGLFLEREDGLLQYRQAIIGMPRKNGKTALAAGIGLHGLYLGPAGAEVYSCAGDKEQARLAFGAAKRMVELDPELSALTKIYKDVLEVPESGSVYRVVSSDAPLKEGLSPTLVVFDELHVQPNDDLWSVMNLGSGARAEALVLAITTAGVRKWSDGQDSLCYRMYNYGRDVARRKIADSRFFFAWWEPGGGVNAKHDDPATWRESNPGFDDIVAGEDFEANLPPKVPLHEYRTKRTNVFVDAASTNWLSDHPGTWAACAAPKLKLTPGQDAVAALDMSLRHDSTALAVLGRVGSRIVSRTKIWKAPEGGKIDYVEVKAYLRLMVLAFHITAIGYDPRYLELTAQQLEDEGLPMVEFPQSDERMVPACKHLFELIVGGEFAHADDPELNDHILGSVWRESERGRRLSKGKSKRPIDGTIANVMGAWLLEHPAKRKRPAVVGHVDEEAYEAELARIEEEDRLAMEAFAREEAEAARRRS